MYNIELTVLNTEKLFNAARFGNLRQKKFDGLAWPRLWPGLDCGLDWSGLVLTLVWSGRAVKLEEWPISSFGPSVSMSFGKSVSMSFGKSVSMSQSR